MRYIFNNFDSVFACNGVDAVHIRRIAAVMYDHDGGGTFVDTVFYVIRINAERVGLNVGKIDFRTQRNDAGAACPVSHGGGNDFFAGAYAACPQRFLEGRRAVAGGESIFCASPCNILFLKLFGDVRSAHLSGTENSTNCFLVLRRYDRPVKHVFGFQFQNRFPAVDCQNFFIHPSISFHKLNTTRVSKYSRN